MPAGDVPEGLLAPVLNCQMSPGLISKVSDDLVSSENGVKTLEKLRKYKYNTTSKPLCRSISRYFIRFLEKDSSRKLIFFLIFGRRFLEKDDFQQDPLLFETRPTPSCKKMADGLAGDAQMRCISNKNIH